MQNLRFVFIKMNQLLKGKFWQTYAFLFVASLAIMSFTEVLQLTLKIDSILYFVITTLVSMLNMLLMNFVLFIFIKRARMQRFCMQDVTHLLRHSWKVILIGFMLSLFQIAISLFFSMFIRIQWLYLIVYALIYVIFTYWNTLIAYGIYDGASALSLLSGSVRMMSDHFFSFSSASIFLLVWYMLGQAFVPSLTQMLLGNTMFAGMIIPGTIYAMQLSIIKAVLFLGLNIVYYGVQYLCLMVVYSYTATVYEEERFEYMLSETECVSNGQQ